MTQRHYVESSTKVTAADVTKLEKALPDCNIYP